MQRKRLGDLLVETNLLTEVQLQQALAEKSNNQKLGDVLLQKGYITEQQLIEVLEFQLGIPHVSLYRYPFDESIFTVISKDFAKRHLVIPLKKEGSKLYVAMADPMDYFAINDLRLATGFQIEPAIATKDDIIRSITKYYELDDYVSDWASALPKPAVEEVVGVEEDSPIIKLVNQLLQQAVIQRASDIHIDPQETKINIRYRVDGTLRTERMLPKHMQGVLIARLKIMSNLDITEQRIPQDGRMKMNIDMYEVDLRISTLPTIYGEKIVIRILNLNTVLNDLEQLGFEMGNLEKMNQLMKKQHGIVLITGPTGSGKSSTLYAALHKLNSEEVNIITIEDPVEYQLEGINQIQTNPTVGLTFAAGLRSILRQDPNIIMVGEIRDSETADMAVRASITGHLVLSTLHTNNSIGTINRLIDMGIEPFLIASSLNGVVSQRLIRKVCRDCRQEKAATEREKEIFESRGMTIHTIYKGKGCPTCNMTGYRGRIAVHEVLVMDDELRRMIMNNQPVTDIQSFVMKRGMKFLLDDGLVKVKRGITTTEEVLRVITD
ncbi:GspE/PulE family protein [Priestia taiwanensis]|uniref:Type II secretion system protein E n=1 Tax=Priestia taiwanensis TaxID=1347902 RepID=A0A917ESS6_9BACI|nr:ATPase, T2SS/T4P/T4SS family [Priestia taiwanensis]MBM7363593.1 type IV pilus assembly protein PilB [Priestia taiwanensis]GGE75790.1 type II secretion system protein E [Priestia taiwanensis]